MVHCNSRLTVEGRRILVDRVVRLGRPVAHVAAEMGVSRQCAHRWVKRFREEGEAGLEDRSSRPRSCPHRVPEHVTAAVLAVRVAQRIGRDAIAAMFGLSASTVSRLIRRAGLPVLADLDPVTGIRIRAARASERRYERAEPGDLLHIDVKKLGRIPDGGGWRADGPTVIDHRSGRGRPGYDYVHVAIDDRTRLAFVRVLPDERGATCAQFLADAAAWFASLGVRIREVMTDNAKNYTTSRAFQAQLAALDAKHRLTRPHCPWQNGKAERFNRTLQTECAYRHRFTTNQARTDTITAWTDHYNYARPHTACDGKPPINRLSPTK